MRSPLTVIANTVRQPSKWLELALGEKRTHALITSPYARMILETYSEMRKNDSGLMAAGVAYYAVLSLLPLALALWGILGLFANSDDVARSIESFFSVYLPDAAVSIVDQFRSSNVTMSGVLGAIGLVSLLWVGSAMFTAVSKTINRAFGISSMRPFYLARPRALGLGMLLFLFFGISVYSSLIIESLANFNVPVVSERGVAQVLAHIPPLLLTFATFAIAYHMLPNTRTRWAYTLPVAGVVAIVFEAAKFGFAIYLNRFASYDEVYGSIASVIVLMVWSYTSAYIVIVGAHAEAVYIRIREGIPPGAPAELRVRSGQ